jgi:hypothetical protein
MRLQSWLGRAAHRPDPGTRPPAGTTWPSDLSDGSSKILGIAPVLLIYVEQIRANHGMRNVVHDLIFFSFARR